MSKIASAAALALVVGACGGKDKATDTTTPVGGAQGGVAGDPANMDPDGYEPGATDVVGDGDEPGDVAGDPGAGAGDGDGAGDGGPPEIRPPGLDMTPQEQQRLVAKHVAAARDALAGQTKDPEKAIAEAQAALSADETSVDAMVLLAHAHYVKGYYDLAEDVLRKAIERGGERNKKARFLLGLVYEKTDRGDQAPAEYNAAIAIDPSYTSALMNLGVHHLANKRFDEAIRVYERLTRELGVNTPTVWTNLASAYRGRSADFALTDVARRNQLVLEAEKNYRRAISIDKNYANAYYNLGILYLDAEPFPENGGEMDSLKRIKRAKTYFDEYRRLPGADVALVDQTAAVAQKLIAKEELLRKKQAEREAKRRAADEAMKDGGGDDDFDSDEGFQ